MAPGVRRILHVHRSAFVIFLAFAATAFSQTAREGLWREDATQAVNFVISKHPGLFTNVPRDQFEEERNALLAPIPDKSDAQILLGLQRLLALARDGHTSISLFQNRTPLRCVPLRFYWFADGIYVTDAGAGFASAFGERLLRVADMPVDEAVSKLKQFISHENDWWVRSQSPLLLSSPEAIFGAGITAAESGPVLFLFEDASGGAISLSIDAATAPLFSLPHKARPNPPLFRRFPERYYWFEYFEVSRTIYIKYNSCQNPPILSMRAFVEEMGMFAESNPIERAVIDVRNNQGGDSSVIKPITDSLAQAIAAGVIAKDKLFVIIGRDTYSSGLWTAMDFKRLGASLVGESTGNSPSHFGNVSSFVLPNSSLVVRLAGLVFPISQAQASRLTFRQNSAPPTSLASGTPPSPPFSSK